jgi:HlyD family secretion protein
MERLKPWTWPIVVVATLLAGLVYAFWPRAVPVDIAAVTQAPMAVTIEDDGVTRIREIYAVSAPVAGKHLRIDVRAGDLIEAQKTVLALIEPADPAFHDVRAERELEYTVAAAKAARDLAKASVAGREAELKLARQERDRIAPLFVRGVVPAARLDAATASVAALEAALATAIAAARQREFELKTAQAALIVPSDGPTPKTLRRFAIRAPISGQVLRVLHESESVVQMGQQLLEVGDPKDLEIVVDLLSTEAVKVSPGDDVLITRWGGDGALNAKVRGVEPFGVTKISSLGIEEQRVNVIIDLTDPHSRWRRLGHGYQIDAAIIQWRALNVPQVPVGALFRDGATWAVFRVQSGRAVTTKVEIGHLNDEVAEITAGLEPGMLVISHPGEAVADGVRVTQR